MPRVEPASSDWRIALDNSKSADDKLNIQMSRDKKRHVIRILRELNAEQSGTLQSKSAPAVPTAEPAGSDWLIVFDNPVSPDHKLDILIARAKRRKVIRGIREFRAEQSGGLQSKSAPPKPAAKSAPAEPAAEMTKPALQLQSSSCTPAQSLAVALSPTPVFSTYSSSSPSSSSSSFSVVDWSEPGETEV